MGRYTSSLHVPSLALTTKAPPRPQPHRHLLFCSFVNGATPSCRRRIVPTQETDTCDTIPPCPGLYVEPRAHGRAFMYTLSIRRRKELGESLIPHLSLCCVIPKEGATPRSFQVCARKARLRVAPSTFVHIVNGRSDHDPGGRFFLGYN
jgi:hypothetical protein